MIACHHSSSGVNEANRNLYPLLIVHNDSKVHYCRRESAQLETIEQHGDVPIVGNSGCDAVFEEHIRDNRNRAFVTERCGRC